jgi:predicted nucleic acid-binding protein
MTNAFIDTNILVYHLAQNHESFSPRSSALLDDLAAGRTTATCASTVIVETIYVLEKGFLVPRSNAHSALKSILSISAIEFDFRDALLAALDFWDSQPPLSFADCYHLALSKEHDLEAIYTFDKKMDRYPGVKRIEP